MDSTKAIQVAVGWVAGQNPSEYARQFSPAAKTTPMESKILIGVARADLAICAVPRWAVVIVLVLLALVVGLVVVALLRDPDWIDYDAPGVDITSEGPDEYTEAWFEWGEEQEGGDSNATERRYP